MIQNLWCTGILKAAVNLYYSHSFCSVCSAQLGQIAVIGLVGGMQWT